jgi:membrane protease YdiL (CAAX protease family)
MVRFATFVGGWIKWFAGNVQRYPSTLWKTSMAGLAFSYRTSYNSFLDPFLPRVMDITPTILLYSILFAITNGTFEEVLWRGTYVTVFPNTWLWSYWYPSIWFGYWHLSPQVVFPSDMPGGPFAFATVSIFMGLVFGWIVKKTGSIRWVTVAHIFTDLMGLAGLAFVGFGY